MRGSPGGILLIGLGVLFLNLAWTGRWRDVWEALTGTSSGDAAPATEAPATSGGGGNVPFTPAPGQGCPEGYTMMTSPDFSSTSCIPDYMRQTYLNLGWQEAGPGPVAGEADDSTMNIDILPTGAVMKRFAPNVR